MASSELKGPCGPSTFCAADGEAPPVPRPWPIPYLTPLNSCPESDFQQENAQISRGGSKNRNLKKCTAAAPVSTRSLERPHYFNGASKMPIRSRSRAGHFGTAFVSIGPFVAELDWGRGVSTGTYIRVAPRVTQRIGIPGDNLYFLCTITYLE